MSEYHDIGQWVMEMGAVELLDWRLVEQPSSQHPQGRWEALLHYGDDRTLWRLAPVEVMP